MKRLADWATCPRGTDEWARLIVTAVVLAGCTIFVFGALHPSKVLLNTTPAGGDMGAHVWAPWFLKNHLFPHGRVSGWAPDWYNGFPALTFYFPGPYLAIALLSYVMPYGIAFKLVSVSGVVSLPLAAYGLGRLTGMKFPGPQLLAVATLPFLFDRYFTIWGGNIASTLAGEFAFSISLSLALLFIGVFAKALETGRYRWLAALLFAGTLFSHLLPTFFAIAGAIVVWLLQPTRRRLGIALLVGSVGLAITAFWLLPFYARLGYSNDMGWERTTAFMKGLFPFMCDAKKTDPNVNCPAFGVVHPYTVHLKIVVALAAAGVLGGLILRRRTTLIIAGLGAAAAGAFRFMPQGTLWNARMLPFWYLTLYLAAAACVAESAVALGVLLGRAPRRSAALEGGTDLLDSDHELVPIDLDADRELVGAGVGSGRPGRRWVEDTGAGPRDERDGSLGDESPRDESPGDGSPRAESPGDGSLRDESPGDDVAPPGADGPAPDGSGLADGPGVAGGGTPRRAEPVDFVPNRWPTVVTPVLVLLLVLAFIGQAIPDYSGLTRFFLRGVSIGGADQRTNPNFVSGWANWNYSGYQLKPAYPEYTDVIATMARVGTQHGCGRAMWEYEPEEDRFGTPMALMLLPMWTKGCIGSQEGLFFESSATVPYHFLNQSELSQNSSRAMRDLPYRNFDIVDGINHLQLLGVRYYMAISPATQTAAATLTTGSHPLLTLVASTSPHQVSYTSAGTTGNQARTWQVYEVANSDPVAPLAYQPVVMTGVPTTGKGWIKTAVAWYQDQARWAVPLAASGPKGWVRVKGADPAPPRVPVRQAVISNIKTTDDRISFDVDQPGTPVLVKTSYFPNWQASGADGPWRVTPNLMVVTPTSRHVELHYGFTPVDNAGRLLTVTGLAGAGLLWWRERNLEPDPAPVDEPIDVDHPTGGGPDGSGPQGSGPDGSGPDGGSDGPADPRPEPSGAGAPPATVPAWRGGGSEPR